jgi:hypothetical protein
VRRVVSAALSFSARCAASRVDYLALPSQHQQHHGILCSWGLWFRHLTVPPPPHTHTPKVFVLFFLSPGTCSVAMIALMLGVPVWYLHQYMLSKDSDAYVTPPPYPCPPFARHLHTVPHVGASDIEGHVYMRREMEIISHCVRPTTIFQTALCGCEHCSLLHRLASLVRM